MQIKRDMIKRKWRCFHTKQFDVCKKSLHIYKQNSTTTSPLIQSNKTNLMLFSIKLSLTDTFPDKFHYSSVFWFQSKRFLDIITIMSVFHCGHRDPVFDAVRSRKASQKKHDFRSRNNKRYKHKIQKRTGS